MHRPSWPIRLIFAGLFALLMVAAPATHAYAVPDAASIEAEIDKAWNELEPTIELYNKVHGELQVNKARAAELQEQLRPLELQVDLAMTKVGDLAARAYRGGPVSTLAAVLGTGSPTELADQLTLLNMVARDRRAQISDAANARDRYAADKKAVDALVAEQGRQDAELGDKKKHIETRLGELQQLRQQGGSGEAATALKPVACPVEYTPGPGGTAAKTACSLIGKPYVWAAAGPYGYDCSGMTLTAWGAAGVQMGHFTNWQWQQTKPVSRADLRPGDLVFFFGDLHHTGLYVGGGWMVHAPRTGDRVRMAKIDSAYMPLAGFRRPS